MQTESAQCHVPTIRRQDISWRTVGRFVEIQIILSNDSAEPTEEVQLVVEAAPLGAFVPFEPVTRIALAGFTPDERRHVILNIPVEQLDFRQAVGFGVYSNEHLARLREGFERAKRLEAMESVEWAGNLNVYFDGAPQHAVEVHRAFDLKVQAGQRVGFEFLLDRGESYSMEVRPSDAAWSAEMFSPDFDPDFSPDFSLGFVVVSAPPQAGLQATFEVLVTRDSDGKTVPVEFSMETVEGRGDTLGCVQA